jgi:hypothetical protein
MFVFTRLLYAYDEVIVNLMFAILGKKDFNKVIFWSAELFYSGFLRELSEVIWKFYYDFYAFNLPFYKINSRFIKFKKTNHFESLLELLYILFQSESTCEIFIITHMIKIKKVAKINNIKNIFNIIEDLLKTKKIYHIINYLNAAIIQNETETIKHYNTFIKKVNEKASLFKKNKKSSYIFAQIMNHFMLNTNILIKKNKRKRVKYIHLSETFIEYFKKLNIQNIHSLQIIQEQRKYAIDENTGIFYLERHMMEKPMTDLFWYHWEYYSQKTPYWKEKYNKYDVQWDEENKTILFPNDNKLEEFYDHYDYELDELPYETSHKSIKKLNNISILEFLYEYFKVINIPLQKNKIDIKKKVKYYNNK